MTQNGSKSPSILMRRYDFRFTKKSLQIWRKKSLPSRLKLIALTTGPYYHYYDLPIVFQDEYQSREINTRWVGADHLVLANCLAVFLSSDLLWNTNTKIKLYTRWVGAEHLIQTQDFSTQGTWTGRTPFSCEIPKVASWLVQTFPDHENDKTNLTRWASDLDLHNRVLFRYSTCY